MKNRRPIAVVYFSLQGWRYCIYKAIMLL